MYFVYIMSNKPYGTLYIGVTNDIARRTYEHREGLIPGFTKRYGLKLLVHYEPMESIAFAIAREKRLKAWNRNWKIDLIKSSNPAWQDLYLLLNQ